MLGYTKAIKVLKSTMYLQGFVNNTAPSDSSI